MVPTFQSATMSKIWGLFSECSVQSLRFIDWIAHRIVSSNKLPFTCAITPRSDIVVSSIMST